MTEQPACTKAIILVAGFGTRRLPITKAIEKCMIPVGNRPIVDYVVQDCIKAGITDIIFVVGEDFEQLKHYYGRNIALEEHLTGKGKQTELAEIRNLSKGARFHYVIQDSYQPYGTSIPVHLARDFINEGERFIVAYGDQFIYREDGSSEVAAFIQRANVAGTPSAMLAAEVPREVTVNYGVIASTEVDGIKHYERIVERPATPEDAPSNLINVGFFLFESRILPFVSANAEQEMAGEHYIIDPLNDYVAAGNTIAVLDAEGEYLDCGTVQGWLYANNRVLATS
jgi:UTP--glucose-1-phosphate uridylyltransferase